ncbi:MAG TPA: choice-of-anchor D domain-containing protein, partial [Solirubrobacteraceae bacterium]|nr:choice-of-anchor D domain-containing protein [Solirubrobacteraceae bacterium]
QKVGTSSLHKVVTVSSTGTGNASIASVAKAGPDAADFTIVGDSCSGASVPHGSSCEVHVTFSPTAAGPRTASLTVATSDAPASSGTVTLGGTGTQPFASVTPLSISYGNQRVGVASDARRVTVKNTGTADLVIASRTLTGANANQWLIDPVGTTCNAATSVAPGASCVIDVRFLPTSTGAKTAALNIRSDASNASVNVSLSGTGVLL